MPTIEDSSDFMMSYDVELIIEIHSNLLSRDQSKEASINHMNPQLQAKIERGSVFKLNNQQDGKDDDTKEASFFVLFW